MMRLINFVASYGESSEHESEESSDDDVSIGKRKGRNGSGICRTTDNIAYLVIVRDNFPGFSMKTYVVGIH